ncbi:hypothetical protein [Amycolatopsis methanolica]|uniref:hypothetical protein n=1 Tax=Amycolatopsis methanolica TaxID=1814 RepID=UPI003445685B
MHYADTTINDNGTVTAFCYCGWSAVHDTQESADAAAEYHQNDDADDYAAA